MSWLSGFDWLYKVSTGPNHQNPGREFPDACNVHVCTPANTPNQVKKLSQLKMLLLLWMPNDTPKDIQILWQDQCMNLLKLQEGIKTGHVGECTCRHPMCTITSVISDTNPTPLVKCWGFVCTYRTDDSEWRMETLVKWSVFEHRKKAAGPDPATLLSGMCVCFFIFLLTLTSNHPLGTHVKMCGKLCCYFGIYYFFIKSVICSQHACKHSTL